MDALFFNIPWILVCACKYIKHSINGRYDKEILNFWLAIPKTLSVMWLYEQQNKKKKPKKCNKKSLQKSMKKTKKKRKKNIEDKKKKKQLKKKRGKL